VIWQVCSEKRWCGRWELNPYGPLSPADFHAGCGFRRPDDAPWCSVRFAVWTIPSPSPRRFRGLRCCPSSLYTFPTEISVQAWLGIAISGFPEFGQFCIAGFPASTQVFLSPLRMPFRHARVANSLQGSIIDQPAGIYTSVSGIGGPGEILSPLRLPVPPPPHVQQKELSTLLLFAQALGSCMID